MFCTFNSTSHVRDKLRQNLLPAAAFLVAVSTFSSQAQLTGEVWENAGDAGNAADVSGNTTGPHANFNSPSIDFDSRVTGYTVSTFLNGASFFNQSAGFNPTASADNIFIQLTGEISLNKGVNTFSVTHDDGVVITVTGGLPSPVVSQPGATAPVNTGFTVTVPSAGNYAVTVDYVECCGPPAALIWDVNGAAVPVGTGGGVPDAASTVQLLGIGLAGLAGATRIMRK